MTQTELFSRMLVAEDIRFADVDNFSCAIKQIDSYPKWVSTLLSRDLAILAAAEQTNALFSISEAQSRYLTLFRDICKVLKLIHPPSPLPFTVTERFPEPFSDRPWKAMCVDLKLGTHDTVSPGIYYKPQFLCRGMFEIMISHEIVHYLISYYSSDKKYKYTSLLEEGVCDILAAYSLLLIEPSLEKELCAYLIHNRAGAKGMHSIRYNYYTAANHVFDYICQYGLDELLARLACGRTALSQTNVTETAYPMPQKGALGKLQQMYCRAERMTTLPATAYLLFNESAKVGECPLCDLAKRCDVPQSAVDAELASMQSDGLLSVYKGMVYNYNSHLIPHMYYTI